MSRDLTAGVPDRAHPANPASGDGERTGRHLVVVDRMVVDQDTGQVVDDVDGTDDLDDEPQL